MIDVLARAALQRRLNRVANEAGGVHRVVAVAGVDRELLAALGVLDVDGRRQAADDVRRRRRGDLDRVLGLRADHGDGVNAQIGVVERDVDRVGRGAAEVAHGHVVGAPLRVERDALDAAHVGRAREPPQHAGAGEQALDLEGLVVRAAEGIDLVDARPALDAVEAVVPSALEEVVAVAHVDGVDALAAGDHIPVRAAEHRVRGVRAVDHVSAGAAVERERDHRPGVAGCVDEVEATTAEHRQPVVARAGVLDLDLRGKAVDAQDAIQRPDGDVVEAVGALDVDLVALAGEKAEVDAEVANPGRAEVADVDQVRPAGGVDFERLEGCGVRGRAGVARDAQLRAVALERELLGLGVADRTQRVRAGLPVDLVEAVALHQRVVAAAEQHGVVATAGVDGIGVGTGGDRLGGGPAEHGVGAQAGLDRHLFGERVGDPDRVRAGTRADRDLAECRTVEVEAVDIERAGGEGADRDRVGGAVAGDGQRVAGDGGDDGRVRGGGKRERSEDGKDRDSEHGAHPCARRALAVWVSSLNVTAAAAWPAPAP